MSLKFRQAFKQTVLKPKCCKRRVHSSKKRTYFSYRFSHKNGYSETSFTSMDPASPGGSHSHSNNSDHSSEKRRSKPHSELNVPLNILTVKAPAIVLDHKVPNSERKANMNYLDGTDMNMHCFMTRNGGNQPGTQELTPDEEKVQILVQLTNVKWMLLFFHCVSERSPANCLSCRCIVSYQMMSFWCLWKCFIVKYTLQLQKTKGRTENSRDQNNKKERCYDSFSFKPRDTRFYIVNTAVQLWSFICVAGNICRYYKKTTGRFKYYFSK